MIRLPTVFVIGAGASRPYGLPLGPELRNRVIDATRGVPAREKLYRSGDVGKALATLDIRERYHEFQRALITSGYMSVDQFLEQNTGYTAIGTLAIALALVPCEQPAKLFPPGAPPNDHWYEALVEMLEVGDPKYLRNRVTFVTYNYDRSLEAYLWNVIRNRLRGARRDMLARHLKHIPILHLHGQLGTLESMPYGWGQKMLAGDIQAAAKGIKVIHQVNPRTPAFVAARKALRAAQRIYFLGFGYNQTNLTRLQVFSREWSATRRKECIVRGTSINMSDRQWRRACAALNGNMSPTPRYRRSVKSFLYDCVDVD